MTKKSIIILIIAVILIFSIIGGVIYMFFFKNKSQSSNDDVKNFSLTDEVFKNPLIGYAPNADYKKAVADNSLVYVGITWAEAEPEEGVFAFADIEEKYNLKQWKEQGKHVVFRFICDIPGDEEHFDIPMWLYEKTKDGKIYDISYGKGYSPNYSNTTFIEYHAKVIKALGEYFGKDNFFSYVELGSLGHWGEWHVKYDADIPRIPDAKTRELYITPYISSFKNAKILMRRPFNEAKKYSLGIFNDMAGAKKDTEQWLEWIENGGDYSQALEEDALSIMTDAWKTSPIGGEFTSDFSFEYMLKDNLSQTVDLIKKSHTTFLGPKCPHLQSEGGGIGFEDGANEVLKNMGYRIGITKANKVFNEKKGETEISLTWKNQGVAPLYWDWPVYIYILDGFNNVVSKTQIDIELSKLIDNEINTKTKIGTSFNTSGNYKICVGIEDPMTEKPSVYLTMDALREGTLSVLYTL